MIKRWDGTQRRTKKTAIERPETLEIQKNSVLGGAIGHKFAAERT